MYQLNILLCIIFIFIIVKATIDEEFCEIPKDTININKYCGINKHMTVDKRYILYDVNPPEGFNLRRDVYVRVAVFIENLVATNDKYNWILVLPPWGRLLHWKSQDVGKQTQIPWGTFFDIDSLKKFIPVIEMYEFLKEYESKDGNTVLDQVYILQNDPKMFETGDFQEKNKIVECRKNEVRYRSNGNGQFIGYFWNYRNISSRDIKCVIFHGTTSNLIKNLKPTQYRSYVFDHMEIPLHDYYGSSNFWRARRSMRYNKKLYNIANEFREQYLNSTDKKDNIKRVEDWRDEVDQRNAIGGPYLAAHLRRQDFVISHSKIIPTIANAARQLKSKITELKLDTIFIATDANNDEYEELKQYLQEYKVYRYKPSKNMKNNFKDGGVAIIDQIICSTARYFIGTQESTFTFRIQEDREILGFPTRTTFNNFCVKLNECKRNSQWTIVW